MKNKWLYDIKTKDGQIVLDNGMMEFDSEDEAVEDAKKSIDDELCSEYNTKKEDFVIKSYKAIY